MEQKRTAKQIWAKRRKLEITVYPISQAQNMVLHRTDTCMDRKELRNSSECLQSTGFQQNLQNLHQRKHNFLSRGLVRLDIYTEVSESRPLSLSIYKNQLEADWGLHVNQKPGDAKRQNVLTTHVWGEFRYDFKSTAAEAWQLRLHKTKTFLSSK